MIFFSLREEVIHSPCEEKEVKDGFPEEVAFELGHKG